MKNVIAVLLASTMAVPAFAGGVEGKYSEPRVEEPIEAPAPAPARYNWTGPYAGVTLGAMHVNSSGTQPSRTAGVGALHFGYNADMGNWVLGGQVDVAPAALTRLTAGGTSMDSAGSLQVRAGPKLGASGNTFAFGALGAAVVNSSNAAGSYTDTGVLIGAGVSHALDDSWILTGQVTHQRFRNVAGGPGDVNGTGASMGVSFRF